MMTVEIKSTVFLPTTAFGMKAGLPNLEPKLLERWAAIDLEGRLRKAGAEREPFILHDGPPYANGNLHIGHALNKILKDVIVKSQQMMGKDARYVPGWDCHGLPIEWKIEEKYRAAGKDKDAVPVVEFRKECRDFAAHWIEVQKAEFKRLGVGGDWDKPYTTMTYAAEARIVAELGRFLLNGGLYKGAKPVLWSVVEKTALAEAEVEYHDHTSTTIWVRFPVVTTTVPALEGASVVIWTTTPWTMPGNRAIGYGADFTYSVIEVKAADGMSLARPGERIVAVKELVETLAAEAKITDYAVVAEIPGRELAGTVCRHPWRGKGYDFDVPLLAGDFVTTDTGTGFVHIAPGHGEDDWKLGVANGIAVPDTVGADGTYLPHVPMFAGKHVFKVAPEILKAMTQADALLASGKLVHSYPHSWRSKAPLIFRNTPQWFISMEANDLRAKALKAIDDTRWVPAQGRNRIHAMVEGRPDWCVSRQRAWGVPIAVFVDRRTGEPLRDAKVMARIVEAVKEEGADVWFTAPAERFLAPEYDAAHYDKVTDILDVWFDSGCTHAFVLEDRNDLSWPAALYLEGSDQHRGWFQSSLLESCGTRGRAPYDTVLTHGFVLDEQGRKMSKSLGNTVAPQDVTSQMGADILRLWVIGSDYTEDLRIGKEILSRTTDVYRRLRNTLRYLLGNLAGFEAAERLPVAEMPELERWVLHRLAELDTAMRTCCNETYAFHELFQELHAFCAVDLSAFYFDVRKDVLYCDPKDSLRRRAARTVLDTLFETLVTWLAPFVCFTAEEAWMARHPESDASVHEQQFPEIPADWRDDALAARWERVRNVRRVVTGALEKERAAKHIGSSLQAAPVVHVTPEIAALCAELPMADLCITSDVVLTTDPAPADAFVLDDVPGVAVVPALAAGEKCQRCWKVLPDVGSHTHDGVCGRCAEAIDAFAANV
ncbi:isoleucyl-tRNA synthetase [uncultured Alphaproteobacteria bacterium]|uniref:Isoleucine--tRNA ligase n=1 Tax=uncultured Alphaproteobacteria bacterium TaxID=91750 RepID=A0A212KLJ5_9PROT|nr:isoleucyl-tRNA synthetase [uncultured Alphaproteobacteria bacterium]